MDRTLLPSRTGREKRTRDSPFRVKASGLLQYFSYDRDSAVDRVADYANESFRAVLRDCCCEVLDNACVDLGKRHSVAMAKKSVRRIEGI